MLDVNRESWNSTSGSDGQVNKKELIIGAVIAVLLITVGVVRAVTRPPEPEKPAVANAAKRVEYLDDDNVSAVQKVRDKKAAEGREKALAAIAEHEEAITNDWAAPDTPDRLMAVGNLYQYQLDDFDSAIQSYASITIDYPQHAQTPWAYIEMAKCYERKGDQTQANYVYREMVDKLDPSLQHVAYAKHQLGEM